MKTAEEIKPNFGPVYASAVYPEFCKIFHKHGYALAVHGSLARDFDLIAIPWMGTVSEHEAVFKDIEKEWAMTIFRDCSKRAHGRIAYTISIGWGDCSVDLSFMPILKGTEV